MDCVRWARVCVLGGEWGNGARVRARGARVQCVRCVRARASERECVRMRQACTASSQHVLWKHSVSVSVSVSIFHSRPGLYGVVAGVEEEGVLEALRSL